MSILHCPSRSRDASMPFGLPFNAFTQLARLHGCSARRQPTFRPSTAPRTCHVPRPGAVHGDQCACTVVWAVRVQRDRDWAHRSVRVWHNHHHHHHHSIFRHHTASSHGCMSGIVTTGPGQYPADTKCEWLIVGAQMHALPPARLTLHPHSLDAQRVHHTQLPAVLDRVSVRLDLCVRRQLEPALACPCCIRGRHRCGARHRHVRAGACTVLSSVSHLLISCRC